MVLNHVVVLVPSHSLRELICEETLVVVDELLDLRELLARHIVAVTNHDVDDVIVVVTGSNRHLNLDPRDLADVAALETQPAQLAVVECCRNHAKKVSQRIETVNIFRTLFFTFFSTATWTLGLTTWTKSRKKSSEREKFFCIFCLTRRTGAGYNGVSQGDTPPPPPGGGGGDSKDHAKFFV